jgi:dolichyl-phosphate beta-glucosyltransferase
LLLTACFLSVIIPAYNEANRLPKTLENLLTFLNSQSYTFEVVVVENGSQDNTYQTALAFRERFPQLRVLREEQRGKGRAVQRGMLSAVGEYRFMCDVDFSMPVAEINRFLPPQLTGYDVAIASREAPGARRYNEPFYRHLVGRFYNGLIRALALPGLHDTQCGFKCFRGNLVEEIFKSQTISGWSFDVEVLFIVRQRGYQIVEVPIPWYFNPESKINVWRDSLRMAIDLGTIRLNQIRGRYRISDGA